MTPILAAEAAPLVQPVTFGFVALAIGLAALFVGGFACMFLWLFYEVGHLLAGAGALATLAALGVTVGVLPALSIFPGVNRAQVADLVSESYRIESVTPTGDRGELCGSVSTRSPVYTGVVNGQQVNFRVGVPDCDAESPDVEILVTASPGPGMTPQDLERTADDAR